MMEIRQVITKFNPIKTGVVTALSTNDSGNLLISINHFTVGKPTLVIQDIEGEALLPIEFVEDLNNSITAALFVSDRYVLYKKMNSEGFDYCKYDVKERKKIVLCSTSNPAIEHLPVYQNKMIVADAGLVVFDWHKNAMECKILTPQEFSLADVFDKGYIALFDEENYGIAGIQDGLVYVANCRTGKINQRLIGQFEALNPMFASPNYFMGLANTQKGVFLWSKASCEIIRSNHFGEHISEASCLAISDDEQLFGFGDSLGRVVVVELASDRIMLNKKVHRGRVTSICFDSTRARLFSGGDKGDVYMVQF